MTAGVIGLTTTLVIVGALLLNLNLRSAWPWQIKAAAIVITCGFLIVFYFSLQQLLGWPTTQQPPKRLLLLYADVRDPDKRSDRKGEIYIWVKPLDDQRARPRAYRLPYSKELHRKLAEAMLKKEKGTPQGGETSTAGTQGERAPSTGRGVNIEFFDLMKPKPPKE